MNRVALVAGSQTDVPLLADCKRHLEYFGIPYDQFVLSAHRNPDETADLARSAEEAGYGVIVAAAGMAAALPGALAAHSILPVVGIPSPSSELQGLDSLLSIAQMPAGVPVATVAIGKAGSANAGVLAAQILALAEPSIRDKLHQFKRQGCKLTKSTGDSV